MSVEYSNYHRDYSYKSSYKPHYRFNKYQNSKESTYYAPKKTYYEDERDYNDSYNSYDNYDNNRYGYRGYKPRKYQKDTRTCNHGFHLWKNEFVVKNKAQPEAENKPEEVPSKATNEATSECESLSGKSTNYDSRKSLDTLQDVEMLDNARVTTMDEILEEREVREKVRENNQENNSRVASQETDESDEEKFSNIDLQVEKKLLENDFESDNTFEDNNDRPIWEDVDTKQILEDIKKGSDFLSLCPQDILILNVSENEYKTPETATAEEEDQDEEEEGEDLNTIFALRVLERGFSRPSLDIKTNSGKNENYQESACSLPIIVESPSCQSAFLPSQYGVQTPVNKPVFKKFAQDYDAIQWYYTGNDGLMQGPFSSRQMDEWFIMGYLPLDLEIHLKESKGFRRLRELVDIACNEGDFLLKKNNNINEMINWFNHYENTEDREEELYPPGIPISPRKLAAAATRNSRRECVSASLMGPKRLAAFNVYNEDYSSNDCKLRRNDSPLNSGISNHSFHNSPVNNNCFNPSVLPFPAAVVKSPGEQEQKPQDQGQEDLTTYAWKSFINYKN